jgi:hypothetical protein
MPHLPQALYSCRCAHVACLPCWAPHLQGCGAPILCCNVQSCEVSNMIGVEVGQEHLHNSKQVTGLALIASIP